MFVSLLIVRAIASELARLDVDPGRLLRLANIAPPKLGEASKGVTSRDFARLVYGALATTGDSGLGLTLGARTPEQALHAVSHLLMAAGTLREACETLRSYTPMLVGAMEFQLREQGERAFVGYSCASEPSDFTRFAAEYTLAFALNMGRVVAAEQRFPLIEVWFAHAMPPHAERYQAVFGCPVRYEQPMNALVFARDQLDRPNPYSDPMLIAVLQDAANQLLVEPRERDNYSERVRQALRYEQDLAHVDFDRMASRWGMTRRTLRRRLRIEGKLLSDLLDEARFREASKELNRPTESIKEIAERLGYAETSSFHRAFKRWAGVTPSEFRKRAMEDGVAAVAE
jgi:AraC-like DNA-binding protein